MAYLTFLNQRLSSDRRHQKICRRATTQSIRQSIYHDYRHINNTCLSVVHFHQLPYIDACNPHHYQRCHNFLSFVQSIGFQAPASHHREDPIFTSCYYFLLECFCSKQQPILWDEKSIEHGGRTILRTTIYGTNVSDFSVV